MRLFLCEKPSQGKDIARVLGATKRGEGCQIGDSVCVTWCIGHLLETAPPEAYDSSYKKWSLDHLPIIPVDWKVEVRGRDLQALSRGTGTLPCRLADRHEPESPVYLDCPQVWP
ncbi:MAG: topoisomerase [Mucilaginibacter sp.]|nr:topoisomerase [Mucilaginibacter sp.]